MASKDGKEILMAISASTGELSRVGIPNEFWFFYAVAYFWYSQIHSRIDKDILLKAIILSAIKNLKARDVDFPLMPAMHSPPDPAVVHALAQWQSVYYDLYCLNQLLLEPLPPLQISLVFECSNIVKFFSVLPASREGDLILQMHLSDADKNLYRSLYSEVRKT